MRIISGMDMQLEEGPGVAALVAALRSAGGLAAGPGGQQHQLGGQVQPGQQELELGAEASWALEMLAGTSRHMCSRIRWEASRHMCAGSVSASCCRCSCRLQCLIDQKCGWVRRWPCWACPCPRPSAALRLLSAHSHNGLVPAERRVVWRQHCGCCKLR